MRILKDDADPDCFFRRLRGAPDSLLMLDYDGTLAPFVADRDRAALYDGAAGPLGRLAASPRVRTVLVSGRSVASLSRLLPIDPLPEIWGSHGWERRLPDGTLLPPDVPPEALRMRESILERLTEIQCGWPSDRVEEKPAGVAVHWRGFSESDARAIEADTRRLCADAFADGSPLEAFPFDGGIEFRAKGRSKADAVRTLLAESPPGATAAYLGDDATDEEAFEALGNKGLSVLVRPEFRPTAAGIWIRPPVGLIEFLLRWLDARPEGSSATEGGKP